MRQFGILVLTAPALALGGVAFAQDQSSEPAAETEPEPYAINSAAQIEPTDQRYARTAQFIARKAQADAEVDEEEAQPRRRRNAALVIDDAVIVGSRQADPDPN